MSPEHLIRVQLTVFPLGYLGQQQTDCFARNKPGVQVPQYPLRVKISPHGISVGSPVVGDVGKIWTGSRKGSANASQPRSPPSL